MNEKQVEIEIPFEGGDGSELVEVTLEEAREKVENIQTNYQNPFILLGFSDFYSFDGNLENITAFDKPRSFDNLQPMQKYFRKIKPGNQRFMLWVDTNGSEPDENLRPMLNIDTEWFDKAFTPEGK